MQANYQLVLPNIRDYLSDIGAVVSMAGVVIGCCDIASIPGTIGNTPFLLGLLPPQLAASSAILLHHSFCALLCLFVQTVYNHCKECCVISCCKSCHTTVYDYGQWA